MKSLIFILLFERILYLFLKSSLSFTYFLFSCYFFFYLSHIYLREQSSLDTLIKIMNNYLCCDGADKGRRIYSKLIFSHFFKLINSSYELTIEGKDNRINFFLKSIGPANLKQNKWTHYYFMTILMYYFMNIFFPFFRMLDYYTEVNVLIKFFDLIRNCLTLPFRKNVIIDLSESIIIDYSASIFHICWACNCIATHILLISYCLVFILWINFNLRIETSPLNRILLIKKVNYFIWIESTLETLLSDNTLFFLYLKLIKKCLLSYRKELKEGKLFFQNKTKLI